jgi:hypothetical protein
VNDPLMNDATHHERARASRMHHEDERVIIIAPVGQDAEAMAGLLDAQGL